MPSKLKEKALARAAALSKAKVAERMKQTIANKPRAPRADAEPPASADTATIADVEQQEKTAATVHVCDLGIFTAAADIREVTRPAVPCTQLLSTVSL